METLVEFCTQKSFMTKMYANLDGNLAYNNVFEDSTNLLSKSTFPVNYPLSAMHILALNGYIVVIRGMVAKVGNGSFGSESLL